MKKIFSVIYSIVISCIFAGAIFYFGYGLFSELEHGALRTQRRIDLLEQNLSNIPNNIEPGSIEYREKMLLAIENINDFSSLRIQKKNQILFNYPENYSISNSEKSSSLINIFEKNISSKNIYVKASLYVLRPATIFKYARISFLIILAATIVTFIVLILSNITKNISSNKNEIVKPKQIKNIKFETITVEQNKQVEENSFNEETINIEESSNEEENEKIISDDNEIVTEQEVVTEETSDINLDENNERISSIQNENINTTNMPNEEVTYKNEVITEDSIINEKVELPSSENIPVSISNQEPSGLFSPVTGFGWQNYLETRLTNELNRATASEIDLSLFIIKIPALLDCSNILLNKICQVIKGLFQFQDLIFEYSDDCFAAMKISTTVDEAIIFGEKVINELKEILPDDQNDCFIGISSRSIRMVEARTILHETQAALDHAIEYINPPVIAFRADAAKYRRYMELD